LQIPMQVVPHLNQGSIFIRELYVQITTSSTSLTDSKEPIA
jgi:hypothetical protein